MKIVPKRATGLLLSVSLALVGVPAMEAGFTGAAAYAKSGNGNGGGGSDHGGGKSEKSGKSSGGKSSGGKSGKSVKASKQKGGGSGKTKAVKASAKPTRAAPEKSVSPPERPEKKGKGASASELKWLNAGHASLTAMANASPNSRVGKIAAFREALIEYNTAAADADYAAQQAVYLEALKALDPEATQEELQAELDALQDLDADGGTVDAEALRAALAEAYPDATDAELDAAVAGLAGAVEADNELDAQKDDLDKLRDIALDGLEIEEDSPAWEEFIALLRLDEPLPEPNGATSDGSEETADAGSDDGTPDDGTSEGTAEGDSADDGSETPPAN